MMLRPLTCRVPPNPKPCQLLIMWPRTSSVPPAKNSMSKTPHIRRSPEDWLPAKKNLGLGGLGV